LAVEGLTYTITDQNQPSGSKIMPELAHTANFRTLAQQRQKVWGDFTKA
jgi:hypothetical protein